MTDSFQTRVSLTGHSYVIHTGHGLLAHAGDLIADCGLAGRRCVIISDSNVAPLYASRLQAALGTPCDLLTVPAGEHAKSMDHATELCRRMVQLGHDRKSFIVALGGGVPGDLAGFVAAIFLRGVPVVQTPTTIVSQVDSSIGGKTGVNLPEGKNLVGSFHQPTLVISDVDTLDTLPAREFNEGFAEVIKHAIIRDAAMFEHLFDLDRSALARIIARNAGIKAAIVMADERETTGERALLNFGHTIGHAIENAAGYGQLLHGEAIALGIVAATRLSVLHAGFPPAAFERVVSLLRRFDLPVSLPDLPHEAVLAALKVDKKFEQGRIRFVLSGEIGSAFVSDTVTAGDITDALAHLERDPLESQP